MSEIGHIRFEIDMGRLHAELNRLPEVAKRAAAMAINDTLQDVSTGAKEDVKVDTGDAKQHINVSKEASPGNLTGEVSATADHSAALEKGSRPHYPPPKALAGWARRHGMKKGAEYAIAKKIAIRGTKKQPYMEPNYKKHIPATLERRLRSALNAALGTLR